MFSYFDLFKVGQLWLGVDGIREWVGDILTALLEAKILLFLFFFATNESVSFCPIGIHNYIYHIKCFRLFQAETKWLSFGPRRDKTCLWGFRRSQTKASLLSYRD